MENTMVNLSKASNVRRITMLSVYACEQILPHGPLSNTSPETFWYSMKGSLIETR